MPVAMSEKQAEICAQAVGVIWQDDMYSWVLSA